MKSTKWRCRPRRIDKLDIDLFYGTERISIIWGLRCQKQVSQAWISNCLGCNYLSLSGIPAPGTNVLICPTVSVAPAGPFYPPNWCTVYRHHTTLVIGLFPVYPTEYAHRDDVIKWKHFPRYWPFVRGIHRSPVNSPHKGQWRGVLMFSLICAWINGWVNNQEADLRRHCAHCDVTVMWRTVYRHHTTLVVGWYRVYPKKYAHGLRFIVYYCGLHHIFRITSLVLAVPGNHSWRIWVNK